MDILRFPKYLFFKAVFALLLPCLAHASICYRQEHLSGIEQYKPLEQMGRAFFTCHIRHHAEKLNQQVLRDRKFLVGYFERLKTGNLSREDRLRMIKILIRHRILLGKEDYQPATRLFLPSERQRAIDKMAADLAKNPTMPSHCLHLKGTRMKKAAIDSRQCIQEIFKRVQPIPSAIVAAQGILESGGGVSSWATRHSNYFGIQVRFRDPGTMGEYKNCRPAKKASNRCVLHFGQENRPLGCLDEYFYLFNSNNNPAYVTYREGRKRLIQSGKLPGPCLNAAKLTPYLKGYAENPRYVQKVAAMVKTVCSIKCEGG